MSEANSLETLSPEKRRELLERMLKERAERDNSGPLSSGQRALWLMQQISPESSAHVAPLCLRIVSPLDIGALRRAFHALVQRHTALRTRFAARGGEPSAVVDAQVPDAVRHEEVAHADEAAIATRLRDEALRPFELDSAPLIRCLVLSRRPTEHYLLLTVHHIVVDLWSLVIMMDELGALYETEANGRGCLDLPAVEGTFFDYVRYESDNLDSPKGQALAEYWTSQLKQPLTDLALPCDFRRPKVRRHRGARRDIHLTEELTSRLAILAKQEQTTLNTLLLAAFQVLLSRSSGRDDVIVGCPTSGRNRTAFEKLVGYFVNPIAIRGDLKGNPTFRTFLRQMRSTTLDALDHQEYPFPVLVEKVHPRRDLSRSPIFQAWFVLQQIPRLEHTFATIWGVPGARTRFGGLECESFPVAKATSQFDIELMMVVFEGRLFGSFQYDTDLFTADSAERLAERFVRLLNGIISDPDTEVLALPLLSQAEERGLLIELNSTDAPELRGRCLHELFQDAAHRWANHEALVCGRDRLTYAELAQRANRVAAHLVAAGVGPEQRVAVCFERSCDMVVAVLAVLQAGGAYVPMDPAYPKERMAYVLEHSQARVLLIQRSLAAELPTQDVVSLVMEDLRDTPALEVPNGSRANPDNLAYVIYTSGSTGQPKGVMLEHQGPANTILDINRRFAVGPGDRALGLSSLSFDLSVYDIFGMLAAGGTLVIPEPTAAREPSRWAEIATREGITVWNSVPALMDMLVAYCAGRSHGFPASLRLVLLSGDFTPLSLPRAIRTLNPATKVVNWGGATETSINSSVFEVHEVDPEWESIPYGTPLANQKLFVLNDAKHLCAPGVTGMLWVGGIGLARGYFRDEERTQTSFSKEPVTGERIYRTGDLARYRRDGCVEVLGRADTQVKVGGYRVELGEVEAVLARHAGVATVVVDARSDGSVEGLAADKRLVAYFSVRGRTAPSPAELRALAKQWLPEYMVPTVFVVLDEFPLNVNGKVDRKRLPPPHLAKKRPPAKGTIDKRSSFPTRDLGQTRQLEAVVARIWKELLGLDEVGLDEHFFEIGGYSLLLAKVQNRLYQETGQELQLVELFEHTTVRQVAQHLLKRIAPVLAESEASETPTESLTLATTVDASSDAVAIIGYAGRFPGAPDVEALWQLVAEGREGVTHFSEDELLQAGVSIAELQDARYVKTFGVMDGAEGFDAGFFGYSPKEAQGMDPQQAIMLEIAVHALEHAGYGATGYRGEVGVFAGSAMQTYLMNALQSDTGRDLDPLSLMLSHDKDFLATRLSYKLDLRGPSITVQTACSTSLVAVHMACRSLLQGECDMALAGGVSIKYPQIEGYTSQQGSILSPDGHTRTFDASAAGAVGGNGAGLVVLKRLSRALEDRDTIHAIIRGSAINNDGSDKVSFTAPSVERQADVIRDALRHAAAAPESISCVEAHGTATHLGDPIEVAALTRVFGGAAPHRCALGSVKTNVGHLNTAAGVAGLLKTVCALKARQLPPSLHFTAANPLIDFAGSPFEVNTRLRDWESQNSPRRAGVSSFGMGGTNAHVVVEEAPPMSSGALAREDSLLTLSARSQRDLDALCKDVADDLSKVNDDGDSPGRLADVAYTGHIGRASLTHRRVVVASQPTSAARALLGAQVGAFQGAVNGVPRSLAFLFPGQGTQYPGMGAGLYEQEPTYRQWIDRGCEWVRTQHALDLRGALFADPSDVAAATRLQDTAYAQPALFIVSVALARLLEEWGVAPERMLGHSVGEYTAAHLSGVFTFEDGLSLVTVRGRLISQLPEGCMLSIGLSYAELQPLLEPHTSIAAINGPELSVASGEVAAIQTLYERLVQRGVRCRMLKTSHAFHSSMIEPALGAFHEFAATMTYAAPAIPFISNVTGTWITDEQATEPQYWVSHARAAVRFFDGVECLAPDGECTMLEVGPGATLGSMLRQLPPVTRRNWTVLSSMPQPGAVVRDTRLILETLGKLWVYGHEVDWRGFHRHEMRRRVPFPGYPFERQRFWSEVRMAPTRRPTSPQHGTLKKKSEPAEWFYVPSWRRRPLVARPPSGPPKRWLLFADRGGLAVEVSRRLRAQGQTVVVVVEGGGFDVSDSHITIRPGFSSDVSALWGALASEGRLPEAIVDLSALHDHAASRGHAETCDECRPASDDNWGVQAFHRLSRWLDDVGAREISCEATILVNGLFDVVGEGVGNAECGLLLGPTIVAEQRYPNVQCRLVDVRLPRAPKEAGQVVSQICTELMHQHEHHDNRVALRGLHRWVLGYESLPLAKPESAVSGGLRNQGVYLITGAFGRLGRVLARALAQAVSARLVLVGRRLDREKEQTYFDELSLSGAQVLALDADVSSLEQMSRVVAACLERFGALHGVIHAAGAHLDVSSLGGRRLELNDGECEHHFRPKVVGVRVLDAVLESVPVDFVLLMSSLSTVLGGAGSSAYVAANAFLDCYAQYKTPSSGGPRWVSVDWDAWLEGVPLELKAMRGFESARLALTAAEGVEAFMRIIAEPQLTHVLVSTGDVKSRMDNVRKAVRGTSSGQERGVAAVSGRPQLATPYVAPTEHVERVLADTWGELLGIERVGVHDDFIELGGHSLLATQAVSRIRELLDVELSLEDFVQAPTVSQLSLVILTKRLQQVEGKELHTLLTELDEMSDDEVERHLGERAVHEQP